MLSAAGWVLYGHLAAQCLHAFRHVRPRLYGVVDVSPLPSLSFEPSLKNYIKKKFPTPNVRFAAEDFEAIVRFVREEMNKLHQRGSTAYYVSVFADGAAVAIHLVFSEFGISAGEVYLLLTADDKGVSE